MEIEEADKILHVIDHLVEMINSDENLKYEIKVSKRHKYPLIKLDHSNGIIK